MFFNFNNGRIPVITYLPNQRINNTINTISMNTEQKKQKYFYI